MFKHILKRLNNIILLFLILCIGIYIFINKLLMKEYFLCPPNAPANDINTRCIPPPPTCNISDIISTDEKSRTCYSSDVGRCPHYKVTDIGGTEKTSFEYEEKAIVKCGEGSSSNPSFTEQTFTCNNTTFIKDKYMNGGWDSTKRNFVCIDK